MCIPSSMAELRNPLSQSPSIPLTSKRGHQSDYSHLSSFKSSLSLTSKLKYSKLSNNTRNHARSFLPMATLSSESIIIHQKYEPFQKVGSIEEFDAALLLARDKLVLVEYIAVCRRGLMPELSRRQADGRVCFLQVKVNESEKTSELCRRENVERVPHYSFHRNKERVHVRSRLKPEEFIWYRQYYGSYHGSVIQLRCEEDVEKMIDDYKANDKLIVLNVGLRNCEPCVRVYPTMVKLSAQMDDGVVFARLLGDDNESCMDFIRRKSVVRVPTFLFIGDGEIRRRFVGSERAKLVRKVLQYYREYLLEKWHDKCSL